ncbi:alpha/beta hydrolase fold domain-containing protein [Phthorimaea operculella]|nr:alpha/beta hydrolase fold domain-containing protein [Phthorimaea operculella]
MDLWNSISLPSVLLLFFIGSAHNRLNYNSDTNIDVRLNSKQFIKKYGYPIEKHSVITEDGYIVKLFRIPKSGPPVFLAHGIGDSSDSWLVLGPANSLAYLLSDAGYDVWLYNARGNKYSKRHTRNLTSKRYWNFSYEEMGSQDLPACIDYILRSTSRQELAYVGFSQGTTIFFVMCSMRPEYNDKIKHAILLAPVAWVSSLKYPFIDILSPNLEQLAIFTENIGMHEIFSDNPLVNSYHAEVCRISSMAKIFCELEYLISFGMKNISFITPDRLPVVASHMPAGASTKTFVHFMQGYATKKFQRFNYYKRDENIMVYGSSKPPLYNLSLVRAPVSLISSEVDWFSTFKDVQRLKKSLPNIVNSEVLNKSLDFTHLEFVYGARAKALVNNPVVSLLSSVY